MRRIGVSAHLTPAPPAFKAQERRQAPSPMRRAATCVHSCGLRINPPRSPAPPRPRKFRAGNGRPEGKGGAARHFCHAGHRGCVGESGDCIACNYPAPVSTKRGGEFARFELPRVVRSVPRVDTICPRVHFSATGPFSLSFLVFLEEGKEVEGAADGASRSTVRKIDEKPHPRVAHPVHGFSGDEKRGRSEHWRGLATVQGPIHASTACFAWGGRARLVAGGVHGR